MIALPLLLLLSLANVSPAGMDCSSIDDLIVMLNSAQNPNEPAVGMVGGCLNLSGSLTLILSGLPFPAGQTYLIIENDGTDPINGTLDGLPEGAIAVSDGQAFRISYVGGSGNDLTLTAIAEPAVPTLSELALMALGAVMLALGLMRVD